MPKSVCICCGKNIHECKMKVHSSKNKSKDLVNTPAKKEKKKNERKK